MTEAPTILGKHGEFKMPDDIWETAGQLVESLAALTDENIFGPDLDLDEMARTIIASALYAERAGMMTQRQ